ncbi:MAG TPA: hypothetical protein VE078_13960 [Thermoanaerobaculia bacterium]|nr:hypothetical protein [Thermoanaerobaculia bacterium]
MSRERRPQIIVAVLIVISLALCGAAEAGSLMGVGGPMASKAALREPSGLLAQGVTWLSELWSDFKAALSADTTEPTTPNNPPVPSSCGDAGPGIDPEGQC